MSQAPSQLPTLVRLVWGHEELRIEDPIWIAKIVQELAHDSQSDEDYYSWSRLPEPRSIRSERVESQFQAMWGNTDCHGIVEPENLTGYHPPQDQGPVASEALKKFIGLEMPIALNFTSREGRSETRLSAVHAKLQICRSYSFTDELKLCWSFSGYQLYASHDVGTAHLRSYWTDSSGYIERRLLSGRWVRWGFGGAWPRYTDDYYFFNQRLFILANNEVQQLPRFVSGLDPDYDGSVFLEDTEGAVCTSELDK